MYTPIKLDKIRNLKFNLAAIDRIERQAGKPFSQINMGELTIRDMCVVIWAGLAHEDPELTPDKVLELIDEYSNIADVTEAMGKAMEDAFGKVKNAKRAEKIGA